MEEFANFVIFAACCRFSRFQIYAEILQQGDRIGIFLVCTAQLHVKGRFKGVLIGTLRNDCKKCCFWDPLPQGACYAIFKIWQYGKTMHFFFKYLSIYLAGNDKLGINGQVLDRRFRFGWIFAKKKISKKFWARGGHFLGPLDPMLIKN